MSIANYKKDYWNINLKNKLDYISHNYNDSLHRKEVKEQLDVVRNEFSKELRANAKIKFIHLKELTLQKINDGVIEDANTYLDQLNRYYIKLYNKANMQKDELVNNMQRTNQDRENFLELKRRYYNEALAEFVTNSNEVERIVEYKGELIQKIDPIYLDPSEPFIKAHFYAPRKMVFGNFFPTFWVNVIVIWIMTLLLYLTLYYRLLLRFLDYLEQLGERFGKGEY
jgi:hypothetical protein